MLLLYGISINLLSRYSTKIYYTLGTPACSQRLLPNGGHLRRYPKIRQTFNLTPSLLVQLEDYLQGAEDYYLKVMKPVKEATAEKRFCCSIV